MKAKPGEEECGDAHPDRPYTCQRPKDRVVHISWQAGNGSDGWWDITPEPVIVRNYEELISTLATSRDRQGLTLAAVGERAGCHLQQVHNWINGGAECRARRLFRLADALGYDLALIPREDA